MCVCVCVCECGGGGGGELGPCFQWKIWKSPSKTAMLCLSSVVLRRVVSGLTTTPIEWFHGHTNVFHELTGADGTKQ